MSSSSEDVVLLNPRPGTLPLEPTGASSQTILQACSTPLAQILPNNIIPSRSLRSPLQPNLATLRKTSISTSRSFSSTASDVWDELPVHVSTASTLPVFRRQAPLFYSFIPTLDSLHRPSKSEFITVYHVVHLTRSSPVPTIS